LDARRKIRSELSKSDLERYDRQMMIPGWGREGQERLRSSRVVVAGAGGLGSPALLYLAAAGVGNLVVVDKERFELSNLNRQILGWERDVGRYKAEAASEKLRSLNSGIQVEPLIEEIDDESVDSIVEGADVVVDALDNWRTRYTLNRGCVEKMVPLVHAGIFGLEGQLTTIVPRRGPCLQCIVPEPPREIASFPVMGATPAFFSALQVIETMKIILGIGEPLVGRLLFFDGWSMSFTVTDVARRQGCPICGQGPSDPLGTAELR